MKRVWVLLLVLVAFATGCMCPVGQDDDQGGTPVTELKFVRSQFTNMVTTQNALGSFKGNLLQNLQQDQLDPGVYTIQFQILDRPTDGLGLGAYAFIFWRVQGQSIERVINVFNGAAISGPCNSVHVQLLDQSGRGPLSAFLGTFSVANGSANVTSTIAQTIQPGEQIQFNSQPGVFYTVGSWSGKNGLLTQAYTGTTSALASAFAITKYKIAATLSRGTRPTIMQPPVLLTENQVLVDISGQTVIQVPPANAGVVSAIITVSVAGPFGTAQTEASNGLVQFLDVSGAVLADYLPQNLGISWYPVPPGTQTVAFVNHSTTKPLNFSIQWGIEG